RKREDVGPAQVEPDALEALHTSIVWLSSKVCGVDRAHGCADDEVGTDAPPGDCSQHSNLHGAKAATASQHECGHALRLLVQGSISDSVMSVCRCIPVHAGYFYPVLFCAIGCCGRLYRS